MINIIGIILGIAISSLWIFLPLKRVPEDIRLKKSKYVISIIVGATICTFVIMVLEIIWDRVTGIPANSTTFAQAAASAFTRAALLEEGVKYLFARRVLKKNKPQGRLQYMLLAGTIGMGYGITEKLAMGSAAYMLVDAVLSMHTIFQFITGWYLYEAAVTTVAAKKRACSIKAFLVPFILHGVWDFILFSTEVCFLGDDVTVAAAAALILLVAALIVAVVGEIKMIKCLRRI